MRSSGRGLVLLILVLVLSVLLGCGSSPSTGQTAGSVHGADGPAGEGADGRPTGPARPAPTEETAVAEEQPLPDEAGEGWTEPDPEILAAFEQAALSAGELPLLRPAELPTGAVLAARWLPLDRAAAEEGSDVSQGGPNPMVAGSNGQHEVRVLLELPAGGRLEIMQGIRGDLGDLPGEPLALPGGTQAGVYELLGGHFVLWAMDGAGYAVFGLGVARDDVVRVARGMRPLL
jgi:hypothetical protein